MKSSTSADREELGVIFDNVDTANLHSYCGELQEKFRSNKSKFRHSWLYSKELSFIETWGLWSPLIYKENDGMFCLLCRQHNTRKIYVTIQILGMQLHR